MRSTLYGLAAKAELDTSYPSWDTMAQDERRHTAHVDNCDNGTDHKERFYVINKGGCFLFYCHNCGANRYYRPKDLYTSIKVPGKALSRPPIETRASIVRPPSLRFASTLPIDPSTEAALWLAEYEMLHNPYTKCRVNDVMLPAFNESGIYGYQVRLFNSDAKYSTYLDTSNVGSHLVADPTNKSVVICEDLLSHYKLHMAGHNSFALMGTNPTHLPLEYDHATIWLDEDVAGTDGAVSLLKEIGPLYKQSTVVINKQPKEMPFETLKAMKGAF